MARSAKVLLVTSNYPPVMGGSSSVYQSLAQHCPDRIIVLTGRYSCTTGAPLQGWEAQDRTSACRVFRIPLIRTVLLQERLRGFARIAFLLGDVGIRLKVLAVVAWCIARHRVRAVCLGELIAGAWLIDLLSRVPGIRTVSYVHGEEITTKDSYDPEHKRARRALLRSDAIVVVSNFTLRAATDLLAGRDDKVVLIENGVDRHRFQPGPKSQALLRKYNLEGRFVYVAVCRLLQKKGVDHTLRAFRDIVRERPDCRFLIVGTGEYEQTLKGIAAEEGISDLVVFAGRVEDDELVDHYRLGDVFIMPNRRMPDGDTEGFGLVFLEANSCGLPVIAGRDGGSRDAVQDGFNGLVVDGNSVPAIADAMRRLAEDVSLREHLSSQALARAANAGWDAKVEQFLKVALPGGTDAFSSPSSSMREERIDLGAHPQPLASLLICAAGLPILLLALPYLLLLRMLHRTGRKGQLATSSQG